MVIDRVMSARACFYSSEDCQCLRRPSVGLEINSVYTVTAATALCTGTAASATTRDVLMFIPVQRSLTTNIVVQNNRTLESQVKQHI